MLQATEASLRVPPAVGTEHTFLHTAQDEAHHHLTTEAVAIVTSNWPCSFFFFLHSCRGGADANVHPIFERSKSKKHDLSWLGGLP